MSVHSAKPRTRVLVAFLPWLLAFAPSSYGQAASQAPAKPAAAPVAHIGPWELEASGTTADLRGIEAVGGGVAWASGTQGTVLRTEDSGYMWQSCAMPEGADTLDFRGIVAWDANNAIVMASGPGNQSRLYQTTDGCSHWTLLYINPDRDGFFDAIQFADRDHGFILGDPVDGAFVLMMTEDGGKTWRRVKAPGLVADPSTAGAFAASNTALILSGGANVHWPLPLFVTGGTAGSMLYSLGNECPEGMAARDPESCFDHWVVDHQRIPRPERFRSPGCQGPTQLPGRRLWWGATMPSPTRARARRPPSRTLPGTPWVG
jgi:hypothetical protein